MDKCITFSVMPAPPRPKPQVTGRCDCLKITPINTPLPALWWADSKVLSQGRCWGPSTFPQPLPGANMLTPQLLPAVRPRRRFAALVSHAVLSKEGEQSALNLISGLRTSGWGRVGSCPAFADTPGAHPLCPVGVEREVLWGAGAYIAHVAHHIVFKYAKSRTVLVFSLSLLCNDKWVFRGWSPIVLLQREAACCQAICAIYLGNAWFLHNEDEEIVW